MKIGQLFRKKIVGLLSDHKTDSASSIFVGFDKLKSDEISQLRNNLKAQGGKLVVTKKTLVGKVFEQEKDALSKDVFKGSTAVVFTGEDPVSVCKTLFDLAKDNENFKIKAGIIENNLCDAKKLKDLSALPSKDVLRGMVVNALASPLNLFANSLNQIILKFVWAIDAIKKQKEK